MPFIGNQPALSFTSFAKQDFTTSATTSYTLDNPVANANELALFINFVRQEPTTAYSASGTTLTLTSATASSDDMYCVYLGKAVQTVNPPNNSVGASQLNYPLTTFSSTGIDDNASANALTIDSSSNLQFNSGFGSVATAYGVRVWLRYNQVNNAVSASGGVSSVTDSSTGTYIINFTNNMPDADYALGGWSGRNANPTVTGESNYHDVGNIKITTGDAVNNTWTFADIEDSTVIIVK